MVSVYKYQIGASRTELETLYNKVEGGNSKGNYFWADGDLGILNTWIYDEIAPDFSVVVYDFDLKQDLLFEDPPKEEHLITIKFTLDAKISLVGSQREIGAGQSEGVLIYNSERSLKTSIKGRQKLKGITLRVTEEYWNKISNSKWPEMEALVAVRKPWLFYEPMSIEMEDCIKQIFGYQNVPSGRTGFTLAKSFELITLFFIQLYKRRITQDTVGMLQSDIDRVFKIKSYLDNHLSEPPGVQFLSDKFEKSIGKIRSDFGKVFGLSPHAYIIRERLKIAAQYLKNTDKTVSEITFELGFTDTSYFVKCFKKEYNTTPLAYRKSK